MADTHSRQAFPRLLAILIATLLTIAACGGATSQPASSAAAALAATAAATAAPTAAPATTPAPLKALTIGVGGGVNASSLPLFYAASSGLFKKYGLDVKVQALPSDTVAFQGLIAKTYDIVFSGMSSGIVATASAAPVKVVASQSPYLAYWFVTKKGINTYKDMEGKAMGVSSPGSQSALVPIALMKRNGVDTTKVKIVQIGPDADRAKALIAGTIDGAVLNPFVTVETLKQPGLQSIADVGAEFKDDFFNTALFIRPESSSDAALKPTIQAVVESLIDMSRQLWESKPAFIAAADSEASLPKGTGAEVYDLIRKTKNPYFGVDGGLEKVGFEATVKQLISDGQMKTAVAWETMIDPQFVSAAIQKMGKYVPR